MKPIRIFRHVDCEGPGYLADVLARNRVPYELIAIDQGHTVPERIDDVSALVFMGGPMSVNDPISWVQDELRLIQRAATAGLPMLGHCLGGQLISKALGATIGPNPVKEIGWLPVQKIPGPAADEWLHGLPDSFDVFHWHGETFTLPDGARPILASEACANQAYVLDNILALQCHVEMTSPQVVEWAERYSDEIADPTATIQSLSQMCSNLDERIKHLQANADILYARWLQPIIG